MPYRTEYVEPELFLEHNGRKVFHAYKNDDIDSRLTYWFTTDPDDNSQYEFDVRDLGSITEQSGTEQFKAAIREAIEKGRIAFPAGD